MLQHVLQLFLPKLATAANELLGHQSYCLTVETKDRKMTNAQHIVEWGMNDADLYRRAVNFHTISKFNPIPATNARIALLWVCDAFRYGSAGGDIVRGEVTSGELLDAASEFMNYEMGLN